jgi:hypothetical protein
MRLPEVYRLVDYWADHPPVQRLVAAYMGVDSKSQRPAAPGVHRSAGVQTVEQFIAALGGAVKYGEGVQPLVAAPLPGVAVEGFPVPALHGPPTHPFPVSPPGMVIRDGE